MHTTKNISETKPLSISFSRLKMPKKMHIYNSSHISYLLSNTIFTEEVTVVTSCHIFKHHFIIKATATLQKNTFSFSLQRKKEKGKLSP
jgi:hypothetical protein